jgi:hypothetical protein
MLISLTSRTARGSLTATAVLHLLFRSRTWLRPVDLSTVYVQARSGAVTLTGTVPDAAQSNQAEQVGKTVPGVTCVRNKITLALP